MSGLIDIRELWNKGLATLVRGEKHNVLLDTPLTSTSFDGDAKSTTAKTLVDLSTAFPGIPAGIRGINARVAIRDSASATTANAYIILHSTNAANIGAYVRCNGLPNDYYADGFLMVKCNADGDIYYEIAASGAGTMDVYIEILGYWF